MLVPTKSAGHGNKRRWLHIEHSHCTEGIIRSSNVRSFRRFTMSLRPHSTTHDRSFPITEISSLFTKLVDQHIRNLQVDRTSNGCISSRRIEPRCEIHGTPMLLEIVLQSGQETKPSGLDKSHTPCPREKIPGRSSSHCSVRKAFRRAFSTGDLLGRKST